MRMISPKTSKIAQAITNHIKDNRKAYFLFSLILLIGIILGVFFVNNMTDTQQKEVYQYLTNFIHSLKNGSSINEGKLFQHSIGSNLLLAFLLWFIGSTVIGLPIVIGIIAFRGFCLGYTIASSIAVWGTGKGILFFISSILLQNIIFLPCIMALAVSGMKMYQSIMKDKHRENIKLEIFRHTIFSMVILLFLLLSSVIEAYISPNLLALCLPQL